MSKKQPTTVEDIVIDITLDEKRLKEANGYYAALVGALNQCHRGDGTQGFMEVLYGMGMVLGQLTASMPAERIPTFSGLICITAERYAEGFRETSKGARYITDADAYDGPADAVLKDTKGQA